MNKKCCLVFILMFFPIVFWPVESFGLTTELADQGINTLDFKATDDFVKQMDADVLETMPVKNFKELVMAIISGKVDLSPQNIFYLFIDYLFKEIKANVDLLGRLIVLAVVCALLQNLASAFEKATTAKLTHAVSYLVLVSLAISSFVLAISIGSDAVDSMISFLQTLMPMLLTLLAGVGSITSAAIFHPVIFMALGATGTVIKTFIFPLIFFAAVLSILSNISEKFQISKLAGLFNTVAMSLMGLFSTVFLGVLAIKGVAAAVTDGVAIRAAKFATGAFVPVVGGMFSDALESVVSSSILVKNAVGLAGILVIFFLTLLPLLKIFALAFVYKLAGAIVQPIGDKQMVECLNGLGNSLFTVFAAVGTAGLLFFFAIVIVVGLGDLTVMLR